MSNKFEATFGGGGCAPKVLEVKSSPDDDKWYFKMSNGHNLVMKKAGLATLRRLHRLAIARVAALEHMLETYKGPLP